MLLRLCFHQDNFDSIKYKVLSAIGGRFNVKTSECKLEVSFAQCVLSRCSEAPGRKSYIFGYI